MQDSVQIEFSICTLYRNSSRYQHLVENLKLCGFDQEVEYLSINNHENKWDCYDAIRYFISNARGKYVIICHDDILPLENTKIALKHALSKILLEDPKAAIFGVVGKSQTLRSASGHFFSSKGREYWGFSDGGKVNTLDEFFLIIRRDSGVTVSQGLAGFHFYGTDLCLNANRAGLGCYVLDYPIFHASNGILDKNFFLARHDFENHLRVTGFQKTIHTTCTSLYAGSNKFLKYYSMFGSYLLAQKNIHGADSELIQALRLNFGDIFECKFYLVLFSILAIFFRVYQVIITILARAKHIVLWRIINPITWPLRKVVSDIKWWNKHWKTRCKKHL